MMRLFTCALSLAMLLPLSSSADQSPFLERARELKAAHGVAMVVLARSTLEEVVLRGNMDPPVPAEGEPAPFGVFVTLVKNGSVRGCFGSMEPRGRTLEQLTVEAAMGAARFDVRSKPLRQSEVASVQVIVSIVGPTVPVVDISEVDAKRQGLLVRSGDRASVLLPGEAKTAGWALKRSLRQVGIKRTDPREMYRFRTVTVYERKATRARRAPKQENP